MCFEIMNKENMNTNLLGKNCCHNESDTQNDRQFNLLQRKPWNMSENWLQ